MMKNVCLAVMLLTAARVSAQTEVFSLEQYIKQVISRNKDIKLAEKDKTLAQIQKKQAAASALPSVGLESGYTRNLTDYYMYFDMSALNPMATGYAKAPVKRDNEFSFSIALRQTLFSPDVGAALKAARQFTALTDRLYDAAAQAVISGATKLYYQCLLLEKAADVMQAAEKNARENYEQMALKYENGQISQFELLQAETRWRTAVPEVQQARRNYRLALNTLKHLGGLDAEADIRLSGTLDTIPALPAADMPLEQVLENRPDYSAMRWEEKLRQTNVGAAKGSYLPRLTGTLAWAYSAQSDAFTIDQENKLWFAGVTLSLPLFTGGYRPAMVRKARVELDKSRLTLEKTREKIAIEISNIQLRLREARERITSAKAVLTAAERGFTIAETTAQNGLATQLQLKDARVAYDQARLNYYAAVYDYLAARIDWDLATGRAH